MDPMPEPGDLIAAFSPQPGRCFRMVYSHQLQSDHCRGEPAWKGQWRDVPGARTEGDQRRVGGLLRADG